MRKFKDEAGRVWQAYSIEEDTPRHHGRWYLVFRPEDDPRLVLPMPEVRWQIPASADRTLATMSLFELRRRLRIVQRRSELAAPTPMESASSRHHSVNAG